jgi:ABC-type Zn uptake system ZnuABC Zn-binding protein ZnuA
MRSIFRFIVFVVVFIMSLSVMSQNDRLQIVASHSILGDVVRNVVGDVADVTLILPVGADPHRFEPTPSDLTTIASADVVFVNGAFYEEGLLESIENAGEGIQLVEVSACVEIIPFGATQQEHESNPDPNPNHDIMDVSELENRCDTHIVEIENYQADDKHLQASSLGRLYEIDCGADHENEHAEGSCDPHVWMYPNNVIYWTMLIRDTLIDLDPANTDSYRVNANDYLDELIMLIDNFIIPIVETLPQENRILITNHDSLGYLTANFGFETVGTIMQSGSTGAEPSVQDIARIIDLMNAEGVSVIFGETTVRDTIPQTIADETGAELIMLYTGSLSDENSSAATYLDYIRYNYTTIIEALGGGF